MVLVSSRGGKHDWTTQAEFRRRVRERVVVKTQDNPLTGVFQRRDEGLTILPHHTPPDLAAPKHLRESISARGMIRRG